MGAGKKIRLNNPALLAWARQTSGYTLEEVAHAVAKPPEVVRAWENGEDSPTYGQLKRLAAKVKRPIAALFLPQPPDGPPPLPDFRSLSYGERGEYGPSLLLAVRELRNSLANLGEIGLDLGLHTVLRLPESTPGGSPEQLADAVREGLGIALEQQAAWRDAYHALTEWRDALFDQGVVVQSFPVPLTEARAFSLIQGSLGGIGLSTRDAPVARVFSLFHEVGHLCLRRPGVSGDLPTGPREASREVGTIENYCDRFAASLLLPRHHPLVRRSLDHLRRDFSRESAERVAREYKVSKYVVARGALDEGLVKPARYWQEISLWREEDVPVGQRVLRGGGADFYRTRVSCWGRRYVVTILDAVDGGLLTNYEAGKILAVSPEKLDRIRTLAA